MKKRKVISVLLALTLIGSCLAGCQGKAETTATADNSPAQTQVAADNAEVLEENVDPYGPVSDEKTVIHVGRAESANVSYEDGEDSQNNYIVKYLQDKLNVEYVYDFSVDDSSYNTKVAMAIASGDMPDVMNVSYTQLVQLVNAGAGAWHMNGLFTMFGAYPKMWLQQDDGSVVYGSVTEETKHALTEIRKLVQDGIIDPSFAVRDGDQCTEMVSNGQAGIFFGAWWSYQWPVVSMLEGADDSVKWNAYLAPRGDDGKLNVPMKSPTSTYIVVKKGCSDEIKEAIVKTVNYQYDLDQSQAEGVRPNGMDSPFSWHYYPINVLHCDYDAKEKQIQAVMDCIDGKVAYDDLNGDGKTWYNGYTTVQKDGFRKAVETNISTANAWGWATGAWVVQSQAADLNQVYAVTYAESPSMESLWATLETQEDEFFLQVLTGDVSIDEFDSFVSQWKALGGDTITEEMNEMVKAK